MAASDRPAAERERGAWLVRYELWTLRQALEACPDDLRTLPQNPVVFATATCLIRARTVLDFLYPRRYPHADDIIADDFTGGRWAELRPPAAELLLAGLSLGDVRQRLDKELAHLSYGRLAVRELDDQAWRYAPALARDILALADCFLRSLREPERSWFGPIPNGDRPWLVASMLPASD